MCLFYPGGYETFNGNTDPSRFKPEVATLIPGLHFFKKGKHGITTHADGGYDAFRPATPDESLPVWRDGEGNKVFKGIAINLHKGGYTTTSSEGCQTVHPDQWPEFQPKVYSLMTANNQDVLPYALVAWWQ
jgi:lysozyme